MRRLTERAYWEEKLSASVADTAPPFPFVERIVRQLPPGNGLTLLEIGCSPGRILADLALAGGYEAHGVDYATDPRETVAYLKRRNVSVGHIERADFLTWNPDVRYDVVTSFGFIEHFGDPVSVLDRHFELVRPGGHVVVGVPNFRRGQHALHWAFDRENLHRHNLTCMSRGFFRRSGARARADILDLSYLGGHYDFWRQNPRSAVLGVPHTHPRVWLSPVSAAHLLLRLLLGRHPDRGNPFLSPYLLAIYRAPAR